MKGTGRVATNRCLQNGPYGIAASGTLDRYAQIVQMGAALMRSSSV
jgi:hypothetical protein